MVEAVDSEIVVKRCLEAVPEVRRFVRLTVGRWGTDDYVPCLVASELVTNAVRHGTASDDDIIVRLSRVGERSLWLEVQDTTCDLPRAMRDTDTISESGRGLLIVEQLTLHWGVRPLAGNAGKVVFALLEP